MNKLLFNIFTAIILFSFLQNNNAQRKGGVIISDDENKSEPVESAILHLESQNKGLIPPRLQNQNDKDNLTPADGLIVYIIEDKDGEPKGFWYYDKELEDWTYLIEDDGTTEWAPPPEGGVIMFHGNSDNFEECGAGKKGTDMEGWHLCNGCTKHHVPDMRGKFVVGGNVDKDEANPPSEYNRMATEPDPASGITSFGQNEYELDESKLPTHSHSMSPDPEESNKINYTVDHAHYFEVKKHNHPMKTTDYTSQDTKAAKRKNIRGKNGEVTVFSTSEKKSGLTFSSETTAKISFVLSEDNVIKDKGKKEKIKINNRPNYYKIAY
ncbi:MAG: hypothetical protein ACOC3T_04675, partial [Bacteroidota bacterium]